MQFGLAKIDIGLFFGAKPQIYILVLFVVRFKLSRVTRSSHYYVAMCDINHGVYMCTLFHEYYAVITKTHFR